ncbi:MAG: alanine dehydrogenase [Magnetococcales bacterium]|nr:alanine dehydrogenase [Magnetococcales bacterium]
MVIGLPKEIKNSEYRVSITPGGVEVLTLAGHTVLVEVGAGVQSGYPDSDYIDAGAEISNSAERIFAEAELVVKVKEPQPSEIKQLRRGQTLFTFFHFAASKELTLAVKDSGCIAIAYETVTMADGTLPLLTPMSEVAGRLAVQQGARFLEKINGGSGILIGGVPGVAPANVVVLGGGVVGTQAATIAAGMGASVTVVDISLERLRYLGEIMPANVRTIISSSFNIRKLLPQADLVISGVLLPGSHAPCLVTREMISGMKKGSVIVDVAIDQGGSMATSKPTSHQDPVYSVDGVLHYCVTNMPGIVPATSTQALTNATFPYVFKLASMGCREALLSDSSLSAGANMVLGDVTCENVAKAFNLPYKKVEDAMKSLKT